MGALCAITESRTVKAVGEPDNRNGSVRIDEGVLETGSRSSLNGHERGNSGYGQGRTYSNRASALLYYSLTALVTRIYLKIEGRPDKESFCESLQWEIQGIFDAT